MRDTTTITTPVDQKVVVIKTWLTALEKRTISNVFLSKANFNTTEKSFDLQGDLLNQLQDEQIKNVVVSVNGVEENILDLCLDMKAEDFEFVIAEVDKVVNPDTKKK